MALGKVGFAGTVYGECYSLGVTLGEPFAECFRSFAECFGHSANSRSPVVTTLQRQNPYAYLPLMSVASSFPKKTKLAIYVPRKSTHTTTK